MINNILPEKAVQWINQNCHKSLYVPKGEYSHPVKGVKPRIPKVGTVDIVAGNRCNGFSARKFGDTSISKMKTVISADGSQQDIKNKEIGKFIPLEKIVIGRRPRKSSGGMMMRLSNLELKGNDPLINKERANRSNVRKSGRRRRGKQLLPKERPLTLDALRCAITELSSRFCPSQRNLK